MENIMKRPVYHKARFKKREVLNLSNQPLSTRRLYLRIKNILPYTGTGN
jgi:hypothetical protein